MKSLLILILSISLSFGYTIEFNKNFSKEISNDEATSYISIYSTKKTQNLAINSLNKYKSFMDQIKNIEKTNIRQNSYPQYRYEGDSNKRVLDGYKATLTYIINSKDPTVVIEYIEKLLNIKRNQETTHVNFSNLSYKVSKEKKESVEDELRLKAIIWSNDYTKVLTDKLKRECLTKKIVIGGNMFAVPVTRAYATMAKGVSRESSATISMPEPSETNISINANFSFECK